MSEEELENAGNWRVCMHIVDIKISETIRAMTKHIKKNRFLWKQTKKEYLKVVKFVETEVFKKAAKRVNDVIIKLKNS